MIGFFANIFGYLLNFLYGLLQNYGLAIIIFSVIVKLVLLPISIKQQKTMKKSAKLQAEMKRIQDTYSNDQEKMSQEIMQLYKRENMSPFSGCLSTIIQIILLFSVFYLVRSPLTYMKKVDNSILEAYKTEITENSQQKSAYPEIQIIKEKGATDPNVYINMNFLGLDLSSVPNQNMKDWKTYIIPILYVISTFISIRMTTKMQSEVNKAKNSDNSKGEEKNELESALGANKMMSYIMPIMSVSIAMVAPLGLALYWLMNNILMIAERLIINKVMNKGEEEENV